MVNEISAEMLLECLYPELEQKWTVRHKGNFYRNYSSDVMSIYPDEHLVELSRDGFLRLLPDALLTEEDELVDSKKDSDGIRRDKKTRMKRQKMRLHTLQEGFLPIDTFSFRHRLMIERQTQTLLNLKLAIVLKEYYDIDLTAIDDPYVVQAAVLMPYVSKLRGDMKFIKRLIEELTGYPVRMRRSSFSSTDNTRCWMPKIHYDIIVNGLNRDDYLRMSAQLQPFADFLTEYFIPFDCFSEISIKADEPNYEISINADDVKDNRQPLLNYNTYVQ